MFIYLAGKILFWKIWSLSSSNIMSYLHFAEGMWVSQTSEEKGDNK